MSSSRSLLMRIPRSSSLRTLVLSVAATLGSIAQVALAEVHVERRGGLPALDGAAAIVEESGLRIKGADGVDQFARWDEVRTVSGTTAPGNIDAQLKFGESVWRARTRLLRDDVELAEPLFREAWSALRTRKGDLGQLIAEGLLRCALARGDNVAAIEPWMTLVEARSAGGGANATPFNTLPPVLDAGTMFSSEISPFTSPELATRVAAALESAVKDGGTSVIWAPRFARILRRAPQHAAPSASPSTSEKLLITLEEILLASDARDRRKLSEGFLAIAKQVGGGDAPPYLLAWRSMAIGRALVSQPDRAAQEEGTLELLSVAATEGSSALGRLALLEAAGACRAYGDAKSAKSIERIIATLDGDPLLKRAAVPVAAPEIDRKQQP